MTHRHADHPIPVGNHTPEHLGDGAYASVDHMQVWVSADRPGGLEAVALDGLAIQQLLRYAKRMGLIQ